MWPVFFVMFWIIGRPNADFQKEEENLFTKFSEKAVKEIKAEVEKLEKHSSKLMDQARMIASETLRDVARDYTLHIRQAMSEVDSAGYANLNSLITRMENGQKEYLAKWDEAHQSLTDTANKFNRITLWFFLTFTAFAGLVGFVMGYW